MPQSAKLYRPISELYSATGTFSNNNFVTTALDDISELTHDLIPVFNDWFELGIELGFNPGLLNQIEKTYTKVSRCTIEMLEEWIKRGSHKTRSQIIEALRSPTLDYNALADKLMSKYSTA